MNPTASFFIKLAIFTGLSLQVCGSDFLGNSNLLDIEDELQALHLSRRQLQRRQATEVAPANAAKGEDPLPSATKKDAASKETDFNHGKATKEEELAGRMFETIIQMGGGLELVTSLASETKEILEHTQKVQSLVPQLNSFAKELMSTVSNQTDALSKSFSSASEAGKEMNKSLQAIEQKPEDANLIKENFNTLVKSFHAMLAGIDDVAIAAIPKLAEFVKGEERGVEGAEKAEVNSNIQPVQAKGHEPKAGEANAVESKAVEPKDEKPKAGEAKAGEAKAAETKTDQSKGGEANTGELKTTGPQTAELSASGDKSAEPKAIEPIVPDVAVS